MNAIRKGHEVLVDEIPLCDLCKVQGIKRPAEYDGATRFGPWGFMCGSCFKKFGYGTGVGKGQKLIKRSNPGERYDPEIRSWLKRATHAERAEFMRGGYTEDDRTTLKCMFCGHVFKRKIGPKTYEVKCPKCKEYDVDVIGNPGAGNPDPINTGERCPKCGGNNYLTFFKYESPKETQRYTQCWDCGYSTRKIEKGNPTDRWRGRKKDHEWAIVAQQYSPSYREFYHCELCNNYEDDEGKRYTAAQFKKIRETQELYEPDSRIRLNPLAGLGSYIVAGLGFGTGSVIAHDIISHVKKSVKKNPEIATATRTGYSYGGRPVYSFDSEYWYMASRHRKMSTALDLNKKHPAHIRKANGWYGRFYKLPKDVSARIS